MSGISANRMITLLICHGGNWVSDDYIGGETNMELVQRNIRYNELVDVVYNSIEVDKMTYQIQLWTCLESARKWKRIKIKNDKDVHVMILTTPTNPTVYVNVVGVDVNSNERHRRQANENVHANEDGYVDEGCDIGNENEVGLGVGSNDVNRDTNSSARRPLPNVVCHANISSSSETFHIPGSSNYTLDASNVVDRNRDNGELSKGKFFLSKKSLKKEIKLHAVKKQFELRTKRSNKSEYVVVCKFSCCKFYMRAARISNTENCKICYNNDTHTCVSTSF